jgi:hypothetical protein
LRFGQTFFGAVRDFACPKPREPDGLVTIAALYRPVAPPAPRARSRAEWMPHFWVGCDAFAWSRILVRHRFAVHWTKWHVAAAVSVVSPVHTALRMTQSVVYGRKVAGTKIEKAPVFIIGHWRSGTTLLHELLIRDSRHAFPSTYECLVPHHFLISRSWLPKLLWWMMPSRRPMDKMAAGWDRPQEDEFAMCMLGQPSPYLRMAFPNGPTDARSLDLHEFSPAALRRWKTAYLQFMREVTVANGGRRLILKSPPHTCRIPTLLELFPDARFIHIVRDPYVVYPSTINLWKSLHTKQGLQHPTFAGLSESVLDTFVAMHARLEETRKLIPPGRFCELRYEDLLSDPLGQVEEVYRALELGDFEPARKATDAYLAGAKNYETNQYELSPVEHDAVTRRWGHIVRRYGYANSPGKPAASAAGW